jgi:hypothetical protein
MGSPSLAPDLTEIYQTDNALEADAIQDEVLAPHDVQLEIRDRTSHAFPTTTATGGFFIAVAVTDAERARHLIREAREGGVISRGGTFL